MSKADEPVVPIDSLIRDALREKHLEDARALSGLTKHEYFAAMAMQSLLGPGVLSQASRPTGQYVAHESLKYAGALLAELEKQK